MTILSVKNLEVVFPPQNKPVVKRVSFDLKAGQTMALVGESGSGKSLTARSILKLLPYSATSHPDSIIEFNKQNILILAESNLQSIRGNDISIIFQEPMTALNPLHTIERQIGEALRNHQSLSKHAIKEQVISWLHKVGIDAPESRLRHYPHELSGGQRQRVMIAMALINKPKILIADEPTTALDVTVQKQILDLIEKLKSEFNMAVLLISHDLGVVKHYSDHIAVMKDGEIVEANQTEKLFKTPQHEYTKALLSAKPAGQAVPVDGQGVKLKLQNINVTFPIKKSFFGKSLKVLEAVKDINLEVIKGQTLGIIGESGSGKSTLAMALLQLQKSEGKYFLDDEALHEMDRKQLRVLRQRLQVVFQDPFASLSPRMTIAKIISEGLAIHAPHLTNSETDQAVINIMEEVELNPEERHRYPHEFSGGQRQRVAIARALILKPDVIVLDEPTSALDRTVQTQVINLLREIQQKHRLTYIFISHDLKVVRALAHNVIVMRKGQIIEQGQTESVFASPQTDYTQELLESALVG